MSTNRHRVGELRPSQILFTFGVGAVVDLPQLSAMVMGTDEWDRREMQELVEPRLLGAVKDFLGAQVEKLYLPPIRQEPGGPPDAFDQSERIGVPVAAFPRWLRCPKCDLLAQIKDGLFELEVNPYRPDRTRYVHANCQKVRKPTVLPARFLLACEAGHLDEFPWVEYAHEGVACSRPLLRLRERGVSGEAADIFVYCDTCEKGQSLAQAFSRDPRKPLPPCKGRHPHLRRNDPAGCQEQPRAILLGASNSWFPITLSALSLPESADRLDDLIAQHWATLQNVTSPEILTAFRGTPLLRPFADVGDVELFKAIQFRRDSNGQSQGRHGDLKVQEWHTLSKPDSAAKTSEFRLRRVPVPTGYSHLLTQVVLVERVREVRALVGYTRLESPGEYSDLEEIPPSHRGDLSRQPSKWAPASEVRGEGIFIQFSEPAIQAWCSRPEVLEREQQFRASHIAWRRLRGIENPSAGFPGVRFALLHSLAHALMRQVCIECGYAAPGVRERIYSRTPEETEGPMAGVLLYTAAPDSEGTLGGLVALGEPLALGRHLGLALEQSSLCASDPLCSEQAPSPDGLTLHGSACHACQFAPETSCERGNKFLDRSLLVRTFRGAVPGYFDSSVGSA